MRKGIGWTRVFFLLAPLAAGALAGAATAAETARPAGAASELAGLIRKLGDPEFTERDAAFARILDLSLAGPAEVMAALRTASGEGADPEICSRCEALIRRIPLEKIRRRALADLPEDAPLRAAAEAVLESPCQETVWQMVQAGQAHKGAASRILAELLALPPELSGASPPSTTSGALALADRPDASSGNGTHAPFNLLQALLSALGGLGQKSEAARVAACLAHGEPAVRTQALYALMQIGERSVAPQVMKLLEDPAEPVRAAAIYALGSLQCREATARLMGILKDGSAGPADRCAAVSALGQIGDASIVPELIALLDDPSPHGAILLLGVFKEKSVSGRLVGFLTSQEPAVRQAAAQALTQIRDASIAEKIVPLLADERLEVRSSVCTILVSLGAVDRADRLLPLLSDPEPSMRCQAVHGLMVLDALGERRRLGPVAVLLEDEDPNVRATAAAGILRSAGADVWKPGQGTPEEMVEVAKGWWKKQ